MPSINLAPGTQFIVEARRRRRRLFMISAVIAVIILLAWLGLWFYSNQLQQQQNQLTEQIRGVQVEISKLDQNAKRVVLFEERLKSLDALLSQHINWDAVLGDIERLLPAEVVLTRLEVNSDTGGLQIVGQTPDVDKVSLALASLVNSPDRSTTFRSGQLRDVKRQQTNNDADGTVSTHYVFSADLQFNPSILKQNP